MTGATRDHTMSSFTQILELLCQILQTDSLSAIQFWLLYAPPKGKDTMGGPPSISGTAKTLPLFLILQMSLGLLSFLFGSPKGFPASVFPPPLLLSSVLVARFLGGNPIFSADFRHRCLGVGKEPKIVPSRPGPSRPLQETQVQTPEHIGLYTEPADTLLLWNSEERREG